MGLLDKAKVWLGILDEEDLEEDAAPRARMRINPRNKDGRPPLDDFTAPPQQSLDDALVAREAGDLEEMRRLLGEMDRGHGLRTVLRGAAALEAGDDGLLKQLVPKIREQQPAYKLALQLSVALGDSTRGERLHKRAAALDAPAWALAWAQALSDDPDVRRIGLVELLFADPPLARTVATKELAIEGAEADVAAAQRFAQMSHGRDCIRRFGPEIVADLYDRVHGEGG